VGRGIGVSLKEQLEKIIEIFTVNKRSEIIFCPDKPNSPQFILDITKTINELGYVPKYDYLEYLKDFKIEMEKEPFKRLWGVSSDYRFR
jgi:UDP-glucose 4-epimerase